MQLLVQVRQHRTLVAKCPGTLFDKGQHGRSVDSFHDQICTVIAQIMDSGNRESVLTCVLHSSRPEARS